MLVKEEAKILGVTFDRKLNWRKHIEETDTKCMKSINILRLLSGSKWGAHPIQMMRVYYGLIRSNIDYGAELYESASSALKSKLDSIQAKSTRVCFGLPRSTANEALQMEGAEIPLSLRRNLLAAKYLTRVSCQPSFLLNKETNKPWFKREWNQTSSFFERASHFIKEAEINLKATEKFKISSQPLLGKRKHQKFIWPHTIKQKQTNS